MVTRRSVRLSEAETRERVLAAGADLVRRDGFAVELRLSMESVIAEAGVARAAAYRIWPTREALNEAVVQRVADGVRAATVSPAAVRRLISEVAGRQGPGAAPLEVAVEIVDGATRLDVRAMLRSPDWRGYFMTAAIADAMPEGELRRSLRETLSRAEQEHVEHIAQIYRTTAEVLGLSLVAGASFEVFARLASLLVHGAMAEAVRGASPPAVAADLAAAGLVSLLRATVEDPLGAQLPKEWAATLVQRLSPGRE